MTHICRNYFERYHVLDHGLLDIPSKIIQIETMILLNQIIINEKLPAKATANKVHRIIAIFMLDVFDKINDEVNAETLKRFK